MRAVREHSPADHGPEFWSSACPVPICLEARLRSLTKQQLTALVAIHTTNPRLYPGWCSSCGNPAPCDALEAAHTALELIKQLSAAVPAGDAPGQHEETE